MNQSNYSDEGLLQLFNHMENSKVIYKTYMRYVDHAWKNGLISTGEFQKFSLMGVWNKNYLYEKYVSLCPAVFSGLSRSDLLKFLKSGKYSLSELQQMSDDANMEDACEQEALERMGEMDRYVRNEEAKYISSFSE